MELTASQNLKKHILWIYFKLSIRRTQSTENTNEEERASPRNTRSLPTESTIIFSGALQFVEVEFLKEILCQCQGWEKFSHLLATYEHLELLRREHHVDGRLGCDKVETPL